MSDIYAKGNNLCDILSPYSKCKFCKAILCEDCDVWVSGMCPDAPGMRLAHLFEYLTEHEKK